MIPSLDIGTIVLLFGWIPFWWGVALFSLYRMNKNDEQASQQNEVDAL